MAILAILVNYCKTHFYFQANNVLWLLMLIHQCADTNIKPLFDLTLQV